MYELSLKYRDSHNRFGDVYLVSSVRGELREYLAKYIDKFSCGILYENGKISWIFYRVYGDVVKWENWSKLDFGEGE